MPPVKIPSQISSHLFMVRPAQFGFNPETAESNAFMHQDHSLTSTEIRQKGREEFDHFIGLLQEAQIEVTVFEDRPEVFTPDSTFPNNWISIHRKGKIILYPIMAPTRRKERRMDIVEHFQGLFGPMQVVDLSVHEAEDRFLEGTGSMVMDRAHQIVYAGLSPRTDRGLVHTFCQEVGCEAVIFDALDESGQAIYHTNVMMNIGVDFAVVCLESIVDPEQRANVVRHLEQTGHQIVPISFAQMNQFAGNMLQVANREGKRYLVMSARAYQSLDQSQIDQLRQCSEILVIPLDVIETYGGGSVRCMMAEVFV